MGDPMIVGARSETASWRASARHPTNRSRRRNHNGCALQGSACSLQRRGPASARAHKCNENRDRSTRSTRSVGQNISLDQSVKGKVTALRNNEFGSTDQRNPLACRGQQDRAPRLHLLFPPRKRGPGRTPATAGVAGPKLHAAGWHGWCISLHPFVKSSISTANPPDWRRALWFR